MAKNSAVNLDITNNADGFDISGGTTVRKLTLTGADMTLTGAGTNTYTFPAASATLQEQGDVLDDLNTLGAATTDGQFIVATGAGAFAYESGATARTSLGLGSAAVVATDLSDLNEATIEAAIDTLANLSSVAGTSGSVAYNDANITGLGSVGFTQELDNGSKTASFSIDFGTDQKQKVTLTANTITLTLDTTFDRVGNYTLKIVNGGLATLTWASESGTIKWAGGSAPTLTSSGTDIVSFYYDGTDWWGVASLNFS